MLAASTLTTALQFAVALTLILPIVAENFTARHLAEYFNRSGRIPIRLLVAEERLGSLVFYLDPALRAPERKASGHDFLRSADRGSTRHDHCAARTTRGPGRPVC